MSDEDNQLEVTHEDLVEQAETVLSATKASMYYPVAHGEATKLKQMIEHKVSESNGN